MRKILKNSLIIAAQGLILFILLQCNLLDLTSPKLYVYNENQRIGNGGSFNFYQKHLESFSIGNEGEEDAQLSGINNSDPKNFFITKLSAISLPIGGKVNFDIKVLGSGSSDININCSNCQVQFKFTVITAHETETDDKISTNLNIP